jgi:hypothetical protein
MKAHSDCAMSPIWSPNPHKAHGQMFWCYAKRVRRIPIAVTAMVHMKIVEPASGTSPFGCGKKLTAYPCCVAKLDNTAKVWFE